ncbi:BatD family protein [Paludibacter sp.]
MKKNILLFFLILFLSSGGYSDAQTIDVKASLDSVQIWIGQQTKMSFQYSQAAGQVVQTPLLSGNVIDGIEIVERLKSDTVKTDDGNLNINQSYVITSFADSLYLIPSFPFVLGKDTFWSNELSLKVIQPFEIDTTNIQVADIKDVFKPKFSLLYLIKKVLPWLIGVILLAALVYLIVLLLKNRKIISTEVKQPAIPPYDLAIQKLDKLKQDKLWQQGRHKEFHSELTEVLREYIDGNYQIPALEMTSDEILIQLNFIRLENKELYLKLQQILHLADLIKFAKWNVAPDEHELSLTNAYVFVNETKPKIEEEVKEDVVS